ncbi:MAG: outer membrane protein transport protein [Bacteroidales bacterium]|nr:outer membrane protein transport protein [Bacteroidales bacterium]
MKKILFIIVWSLLGASVAGAQEVTSYDTDSTAYYNAAFNPAEYGQAPIKGPQRKLADASRLHTNVNMGVGVGGGGSFEYVNPTFYYDLSKKWSLNFGMGVAYSTFKLKNLACNEDVANYQNLRAISNYYSAGATYRATERLSLYGNIIYEKSMPVGGGNANGLTMDNDRYMATFGATYRFSEKFSIGVEFSHAHDTNPYSNFSNPYSTIYHNPYSPW